LNVLYQVPIGLQKVEYGMNVLYIGFIGQSEGRARNECLIEGSIRTIRRQSRVLLSYIGVK
jgi:hypothetical protein